MNTEVKYSAEARRALKEGVDMVANAVKVSLGAEGRNMVIPQKTGGMIITKDGVSIAKTILPTNIFTAIGASLIKEAAGRTNDQAGDGTTTATVLAQAIYNEGLKLVEEGASPVELKKGIDHASEQLVKILEKRSKKVSKKNLKHVATISANGDEELGALISKAFNKIGKHGTVMTEESMNKETYVELRNGVVLDRGYTHPIFATDKVRGICELENPYILLHRGKLERSEAFIKLINSVFGKGTTNSLLIIADDMDPFNFSTIVKNVQEGRITNRVCIVKTPQIFKIEKDLMDDLAVLTGGTVVDRLSNSSLNSAALGRIKKATITDKDTTIVGDNDNVSGLVAELEQMIENENDKHEKQELQERHSRLTGGVATLYVAAKSDSELKERLDRVEDAINATRSALEEGIVPGAGIALIEAANEVFDTHDIGDQSESFHKGFDLVMSAIVTPFEQILTNAGLDPEDYTLDEGKGVDVTTGELVDLMDAGIIDPKKVTRCALENAASIAGTFLTTEGVVAPVDKDNT